MQNRTCQNCRKEFQIDADDLGFYEQIKVPSPTWCAPCRRLRRFAWTGYHILYKRPCAFTGEQAITIYHPDAPYITYKQDIWWSDQWDAKSYGRDDDFSKSFFTFWGNSSSFLFGASIGEGREVKSSVQPMTSPRKWTSMKSRPRTLSVNPIGSHI